MGIEVYPKPEDPESGTPVNMSDEFEEETTSVDTLSVMMIRDRAHTILGELLHKPAFSEFRYMSVSEYLSDVDQINSHLTTGRPNVNSDQSL